MILALVKPGTLTGFAKRQHESACLRLKRELGRFLACLGQGTEDLNTVLYQQMTRDIATAERLRNCLEKLGGYPEWEPELKKQLDRFAQSLQEGQIRARLLGGKRKWCQARIAPFA